MVHSMCNAFCQFLTKFYIRITICLSNSRYMLKTDEDICSNKISIHICITLKCQKCRENKFSLMINKMRLYYYSPTEGNTSTCCHMVYLEKELS